MWKKIVSLITLTMVIGLVGPGVSAATFDDTAGTRCEIAVEVLAGLGIVNGKTETAYEPESTLTRAEMATIILRTMNLEAGASGKDIFTDVPQEHWAYANVASAYQLGIISGMGDGIFAPDSVVTYEQAVKMVVASLGYTLQAEAQGGYPSGYLAKAAQLDILNGVAQEAEMTRGNMAILLYNALDVPMFLQSTYGQDSYDYAVSEQDTLLSYYLKVNKVTSHVIATPMAQITAPSRTLLSDEVAIDEDGLVFKKGSTNVQDMLGEKAVFYLKTEGDSETPVALAAVRKSSTVVLDIAAKAVEGDTTKSQLIYTENGKEEKVDISGAELVWNGRVKTNWTENDLQPETGTVRVVKNGNAAPYIIVESYVNYIVDTVVPDTMEIFFMNNADPDAVRDKIVVDPDDRYTVLTDEIGMPITIEACYRWDVISIAESEDQSVKKMVRCYNVAKGTVREIGQDTVRIDDTEYPVTNPLIAGSIELGQSAGFCLDFTGTITAVNTSVSTGSEKYGWLVNAVAKKGLDGSAQLKIFTADNTMTVFDVADNVVLDGNRYSKTNLLNGTNALYQNGQVYPQLVKYKTNADGTAITELDTAENRTLAQYTDTEKTDGSFSMDYYVGVDQNNNRRMTEFGSNVALNTSGMYNLGGVLFGRVRTTSETPVFEIPRDTTQEGKYKVATMRDYGFDVYNQTKYFAVYDVDEYYKAGACVVHNYLDGQAGGVATVSYPMYNVGSVAMITGTSLTLDEAGEAVYTLKLYTWDGKEAVVTAPEDFECLYRTANADFLQDPDWYNVKGQPRDESLVPSTGFNNPNSSGYGVEFRPQRMMIDVKALDAGDVIHYTTDASGTLTMAAVQMRSAWPGKVEMSPSATANLSTTGNINVTSENNYYSGYMLLMSATVTRTTDDGPLLSVNLSDKAGRPNGKTAVRAIPTSGNFVLWDKEKQTMRTITPQEIRVNDELFSIWRTNSQKLVIVYR